MYSKLASLLSLFQLKEIEKEIFEKIFESGFLNASELARQVHITRTSVYDYLESLKEKGLITQTLKGGVRIFSVELPEKIQLLVKEKEKHLATAKGALNFLKDEYGKHKATLRPRLQMSEGREELRQMMKDLLLYENIMVRVYWPILDVIKLLGPKFVEEFNNKRQNQNIRLRTIWPSTETRPDKQYSFLKIGEESKREVRFAPAGVDFSLGYAIYENTTRFISSSKESFGFLITSREFAQTMKTNFDIIWDSLK